MHLERASVALERPVNRLQEGIRRPDGEFHQNVTVAAAKMEWASRYDTMRHLQTHCEGINSIRTVATSLRRTETGYDTTSNPGLRISTA